MDYRYRNIATATFDITIGNVEKNTKAIIDIVEDTARNNQNIDVLVFPELCITGYTCADMFLRRELTERAADALNTIAQAVQKDILFGIIKLYHF